jgi:hypothetical protein
MLHPIDPYVVRKLADCIELLPKYINSPQKMPFVQEVIQRALEQINSDREAIVRGIDALTRGDELVRKSPDGRKYSYEIGAPLPDAEKYREPVTAVWLSDSDQKDLKDGFDEDDTGIFEFFERQAALIAEWLKEYRHPRDAELFRSRFSFACGEALLHAQGVEVSPGVYRLDLSTWETEVAKLLCEDLRELAVELETVQASAALQNLRDRIEVNVVESKVRLDDTWYNVNSDVAVLFDAIINSHPKPVFASHLDGDIRPDRVKKSLPRPLKAIFKSAKGRGCWLEI